MSHHTIEVGGVAVEVFNTELAARLWLKKNPGPCRVLVRGKSYFQRNKTPDGLVLQMKIHLNATRCEQNERVLDAANSVNTAAEIVLDGMARAELAKHFGNDEVKDLVARMKAGLVNVTPHPSETTH